MGCCGKYRITNNNYLKGYFEFIVWEDDKILFMDYNRTIYNILKDFTYPFDTQDSELKGFCANTGIVEGRVSIITNPLKQNINYNDILVSKITTIDYLPLMKKAKAIITEQGNILSHASIVARELAKPCLVGVKDVTKKLKNGDIILMNAGQCTIEIKKRA